MQEPVYNYTTAVLESLRIKPGVSAVYNTDGELDDQVRIEALLLRWSWSARLVIICGQRIDGRGTFEELNALTSEVLKCPSNGQGLYGKNHNIRLIRGGPLTSSISQEDDLFKPVLKQLQTVLGEDRIVFHNNTSAALLNKLLRSPLGARVNAATSTCDVTISSSKMFNGANFRFDPVAWHSVINRCKALQIPMVLLHGSMTRWNMQTLSELPGWTETMLQPKSDLQAALYARKIMRFSMAMTLKWASASWALVSNASGQDALQHITAKLKEKGYLPNREAATQAELVLYGYIQGHKRPSDDWIHACTRGAASYTDLKPEIENRSHRALIYNTLSPLANTVGDACGVPLDVSAPKSKHLLILKLENLQHASPPRNPNDPEELKKLSFVGTIGGQPYQPGKGGVFMLVHAKQRETLAASWSAIRMARQNRQTRGKHAIVNLELAREWIDYAAIMLPLLKRVYEGVDVFPADSRDKIASTIKQLQEGPMAKDLPCRAGLRPSSTSSSTGVKASDYLVGQALEEAERSGEELQIAWPFQSKESSKQESQTTHNVSNGTSVANGKARSFPDSSPDWLAMEALFRHVVAVGLNLGAKPVNYLFLLSVPAQLPPGAWERVTQIFFESLCVSSFLIVERALLQLYSCAAVSGIVVEVEAESTQVSVIYDTQICHACTMQSDVGEKECDLYLANLLLETNPDLPQQLAADGHSALQGIQLQDALLSIVSLLKHGEWIKVSGPGGANGTAGGAPNAAGEEEEEGITDVAKALASGKVNKLLAKGGSADGISLDTETDTLLVPHPNSATKQSIAIGPERHRYADPLFDPSVLQTRSAGSGESTGGKVNAIAVQALVAAAMSRYPSPDHRAALWDNVILTGSLARIRGMAPTLINLLQKYARESPINPQDPSEKRQARHQKTPEYFSEYRERPDLTGFLGGCIYAKVADESSSRISDFADYQIQLGFLESQGGEWMTKQAYNQHGPRIATMLSNK